MKTKFLITCLFVLGLATSAIAAQCWGPNCNTGTSLSRTFEQGSRNGSKVSTSAAPTSSYGKSSSSIFSPNYSGPMSGTILKSDPSCSNKGRSILEDGPCMKACPGGCNKISPTPCEEELPCCQEEPCMAEPAPAPCMAAPTPCMTSPCPAMVATPCMTTAPYLPVANPVQYINRPQAVDQCAKFAPIELQYVDFRISQESKSSYSKKLGNYRFRIFGCRRPAKNIMLNQGRTLQKDMRLIEVFERTVGDCLNIIKVPTYLCLDAKARLPEYILTAEIVDYHMNVCDEFDYQNAASKNSRKGSSEITVVWRLMDLTKTETLWKGMTSGYGELKEGELYGENTLIEKAFADASNNLRQDPEFENQLTKRVHPKDMSRTRQIMIETQRLIDPAKCDYGSELTIRSGKKPKSIFEKQFTRKDGVTVYITKCGSKIYQDKDGEIMYVIKDGNTYPIDKNKTITNPDGSQILTAIDGTKIYIDKHHAITKCDCEDEALEIVEEVTIKEPVQIIEKVTIEEPVAVIERITTTPTIFEEEKVEIIDRGGADALFDVTLIEDDITVNSDSRICIYERKGYDSLTPENMALVKSSMVLVTNVDGKKGSGLLVSEDLIVTSSNMIVKDKNSYTIKTTDGRELTAKAFRINLKKNTALLLLDKETSYSKMAIGLELPRIGQDQLTSLGILPLDNTPFTADKSIKDASGKTLGYRYSDDIGTELIVDTFIQGTTEGGAVIDENGRYRGISVSGKRLGDGPDIFIPIETALKSVGLEICGREFEGVNVKTDLIEKPIAQAPEKMDKKKRK